jgi:hypothetical protein
MALKLRFYSFKFNFLIKKHFGDEFSVNLREKHNLWFD